MINLKPMIVQALESNPTLISLLGGFKIYNITKPNQDENGNPINPPYITFFEITNFDSDYADDEPFASEIHFQIDIWSMGSTSKLAQEVDGTMKKTISRELHP